MESQFVEFESFLRCNSISFSNKNGLLHETTVKIVLEISSVEDIVKVGDTISDIKEGKSAGVFTIGVLEGSSLIGIFREEYEALDEEKKEKILTKATIKYEEAGADAVIRDMRGLLEYV